MCAGKVIYALLHATTARKETKCNENSELHPVLRDLRYVKRGMLPVALDQAYICNDKVMHALLHATFENASCSANITNIQV